MAIYQLSNELVFPNPLLANEDGLLAIGGDLSPQRLLLAYANGIFPWFSEGESILWYALNPRMVLFPDKFKLSKSLRKTIRDQKFEVKFDTNFKGVIKNCSKVNRKDQEGTWINSQMIEAYNLLHQLGFAHSVETYLDGELVGGLYGVSIGKVFCGESMFFTVSDASKVALYYLVQQLQSWNFKVIDVQQATNHLRSLGAEEIDLFEFLNFIEPEIDFELHRGKWTDKGDTFLNTRSYL